MGSMTGFYLHPASSLHDTGWGHPEHQGRLRALASTVGKDLLTLYGHVEQMKSGDASLEDLGLVHTSAHINAVRAVCDRAKESGRIESVAADTNVSASSWEAALGSVGSTIEAARAVAEGEISNAFVAARPPGHHATPDGAMGFCLFNNVAVAARWLQAMNLAERILILDWDVHHGNGTQDTFYEDDSVFFVSLHQSSHYPGSGAADETGAGLGLGRTLNVPLSEGISAETYKDVFAETLASVADRFDPDFVLVSSGFDCLAGDPLGGFLLEPEDLHWMTRRVTEYAYASCNGRIVAVLEGGYDPKRLGAGTLAVIRALADLEVQGG